MLSVLTKLRHHFDTVSMRNRMTVFCDQGVQIEGWFKGELLYALQQLKEKRRLTSSREKRNTVEE